jgi:ABC-type nitrate/sulfonate/bicarbonate transport system substrate-binding protein
MKKVTIAGVPEHFNYPWHMAIADGAFQERGIDLTWTEVPEGTGRMCQMLQEGTSDMAIILTEGIVKSITEGNPVRIVQEYIASPLLWGIHVASKSAHNSIADLKGAKVAISRYGSGSHLMAYVHAQANGWNPKGLTFEVINDLDGAVSALTQGTADYFMWEHFTTKPLVDKGTFRRLGDCPTPWPCFMIVARTEFLEQNEPLVTHILEVINTYTREFKAIPSIDRTLSNTYGQELNDIQEWLGLTTWSQSNISEKTLKKVQDMLMELNLIETKLPAPQFIQKGKGT